MSNIDNKSLHENPKNKSKGHSFAIVLTVCLVALSIAFLKVNFQHYGGLIWSNRSGFNLAEAFGGSLLFPTIHVAIASFWKSKRNRKTRRKVFFNWSIVTIILQSVAIISAGIK
ncbi:MAG: hypothetical protein P8H03_06330 [Emcibacteraceae bacterium]|nr:hypothetical protein [Emcibacteraceae bacterium]